MGMVSVEDSTRSVAAEGGGGATDLMGPNRPVETVSSPNDLTGLGIRITEFLTDWAENDNKTVVCFDSLTALLQYVELETAYEFLHIITGRMAAVDASAHFHMDPDAHEEQTIEGIATLMDAIVEVEGEDRKVRSRSF
jgi:archaellum biogenesis ATPase FlaH